VEQIRRASASFPAKTSQTADGFHVRHWAMLPDEALEALALIIRAILGLGYMPRQLEFLVGFLTPKAKSGHRALGLFPSLYRLILRLRKPALPEWESVSARPFFSFSSGHSCVWALWQQAARAEAAVAEQEHTAMFLWDLADYYEHIDRDILRGRVLQGGFPMDVLDVSAPMYGALRFLTLARLASRSGYPTRGVVAGCGAATFHVQPFAAPPLEPFVLRHPCVHLNVHVDDFIVQARGSSETLVVSNLGDAADDLGEVIFADLKCEISVGKASLAASSQALQILLGRRLGVLGHYTKMPAALNLGIDFAAGKKRRTFIKCSKIRTRLTAAAKRKSHIDRIKRGSRSAARSIFAQGLLPAAVFGCEVQGFDNVEIRALQDLQLAASGQFGTCKSRSMALLLARDLACTNHNLGHSAVAGSHPGWRPLVHSNHWEAVQIVESSTLARTTSPVVGCSGTARRNAVVDAENWMEPAGPLDIYRRAGASAQVLGAWAQDHRFAL